LWCPPRALGFRPDPLTGLSDPRSAGRRERAWFPWLCTRINLGGPAAGTCWDLLGAAAEHRAVARTPDDPQPGGLHERAEVGEVGRRRLNCPASLTTKLNTVTSNGPRRAGTAARAWIDTRIVSGDLGDVDYRYGSKRRPSHDQTRSGWCSTDVRDRGDERAAPLRVASGLIEVSSGPDLRVAPTSRPGCDYS
jgi:hypothetical protein